MVTAVAVLLKARSAPINGHRYRGVFKSAQRTNQRINGHRQGRWC